MLNQLFKALSTCYDRYYVYRNNPVTQPVRTAVVAVVVDSAAVATKQVQGKLIRADLVYSHYPLMPHVYKVCYKIIDSTATHMYFSPIILTPVAKHCKMAMRYWTLLPETH